MEKIFLATNSDGDEVRSVPATKRGSVGTEIRYHKDFYKHFIVINSVACKPFRHVTLWTYQRWVRTAVWLEYNPHVVLIDLYCDNNRGQCPLPTSP